MDNDYLWSNPWMILSIIKNPSRVIAVKNKASGTVRGIESLRLIGIHPYAHVTVAMSVLRPEGDHRVKSGRINPVERTVEHIGVNIYIAPSKPQWVFIDKAMEHRRVIPGAIVIKSVAFVLASGVLRRIAAGRARDGGVAKRIILARRKPSSTCLRDLFHG